MKRMRETQSVTLSSAKRKKNARNHKIIENETVVDNSNLNGRYVLSIKRRAFIEKNIKKAAKTSGKLTNVSVI